MVQAAIASGAKFVNLGELSLSGSLVPSVPCQILLKYNPPKLTLTYYFEQAQESKFYHEIPIDAEELATCTVKDVVSNLYVSEAYYFNPKQVKRPQLERLVEMMKANLHTDGNYTHNIQQYNNEVFQNAANPAMSIQNNQENQWGQMSGQRKKNFFERKRWINYQGEVPNQPNTSATVSEIDENETKPTIVGGGPLPNSGALRGINNTRRRLNQINNNQENSSSALSDMPSTDNIGLTRTKNSLNNPSQLPPLRGRHGPISDPQFVPQGQRVQAMPAFQQQPDIVNDQVHVQDQGLNEPQDFEPNQEEFADGEQPVNEGAEDPALDVEENANEYDEEDAQSVYMLNGEVMRLIQIEGKEGMFLMSKLGCIYDMNGNEIGRANTACLEEFRQEGDEVVEGEDNQQQYANGNETPEGADEYQQ